MLSDIPKILLSHPSARHCLAYLGKAAVSLVLIYAIGMICQILPPLAVALIWAMLAALVSIAVAYPFVIKKIHKQLMFQEGVDVSRYLNGRKLVFLASYALSVPMVASLILEVQRWSYSQWIFGVVAIFIFLGISLIVGRISRQRYRETFQTRGTLIISRIVAGIVLTLVYLIINYAISPQNFASLGETLSFTKQLFADSPSALLVEAGKANYVITGLSLYGIQQAEHGPFLLFFIIQIVTYGFMAFALSNILGFCAVESKELKRVFLNLEETSYSHRSRKTLLSSLGTLIVCIVMLVGLFMYFNDKTEEIQHSQEFSSIETMMRNVADISACKIGDKNYDTATVTNELNELWQSNPSYQEETDDLTQAINDAYDTCLGNVDAYLDWYYSPLTGIDRIINTINNSFEDYIQNEYHKRITEGVDISELNGYINAYNDSMRGLLEAQLETKLSDLKVYGLPDWIIKNNVSLDDISEIEPLDNTLPLDRPEKFSYTKRDEYKQAIIDAIESSRTELLDQISNPSSTSKSEE